MQNNVYSIDGQAWANQVEEKEIFLDDAIKELQSVNRKLAKLNVRKEELVRDIIAAFGHKHEGQKTYEHAFWKVEIKTPVVYSLNREKYESGEIDLPASYNPVKQSITYSVDKKMCDKFIKEAPEEVKSALVELITKKPGKANITIKEKA